MQLNWREEPAYHDGTRPSKKTVNRATEIRGSLEPEIINILRALYGNGIAKPYMS